MARCHKVSLTLLVSLPLVLFGLLAAGSAAHAMDFTIDKRFGRTLVVANGAIVPGDADRLRAMVAQAQLHPHGHRVLELNSPGGDVESALLLGDVIHDSDFHVVVAPGRVCASACGAVLFLAGKLRTVMEGAEMNLHTCDENDTRWPTARCNAAVEDHARSRGVAHEAILSFMRAAPPEDRVWFGRREAECAGLTEYYMQDRDHFGPIGPCFRQAMTGEEPGPALRWRIDMRQGGYYAFIRSFNDYDKLAQTEIYCNAGEPGRLFVSTLLPEFDAETTAVFEKMTIELDDHVFSTTSPMVHLKDGMRAFSARFPESETLPLLTRYEHLIVGLKFSGSETPIYFGGSLRGGRKALIFAANHCEQ